MSPKRKPTKRLPRLPKPKRRMTPRVPTLKMVAAAVNYIPRDGEPLYRGIWRAMWDAAP